MAFKFSGSIRKDYLARDILLTLIGSSPNFVSELESKSNLPFELVNLSVDMASLLLDRCQIIPNKSEDFFNQPSSVVLDGDLGDL